MSAAPQPLPDDPRWSEQPIPFDPNDLTRLREDESLEVAREAGRRHARESRAEQGLPETVTIEVPLWP